MRQTNPSVALAFEDVYRTYFKFVWRTLSRFGIRDVDLMDYTQNAFIVVHRQLPGFRGSAQLSTWLFAICRLVAKDYRRSAPIRREVIVDVRKVRRSRVSSETPLEYLSEHDLSRLAHGILEKMPENLRAVFRLVALEEMSGHDIANLLEIPVGTVRSRMRRARERMRRELGSSLADARKA